jgi:glycoside/pentoside/hexuronide:cation symporter, GPH family
VSLAKTPGELPRSQIFLYSLLGMPIGMTLNAFLFLMPAYYAKHTSVGMASIASALLIARCVEIATDPLIGFFSDRTRGRFGPRKPWIAVGAAIAPVAAYFVYHPAADVGWMYFLTWSGLTYFSWGLVNIPTLAWGTELGRTYDQRSRLFTNLGVAAALGTMLFAAIPLMPTFAEAEISPRTVAAIGWTIAVIYPLTVVPALIFGRQGPRAVVAEPMAAMLRALRDNLPLWRLVGSYSLGGFAAGSIVSGWFFYSDIYLRAGAMFPYTLLAFYLGNALALPVWLKIMLRIGKHRAWAVGWSTSAVIALGFPYLSADGSMRVGLVAMFGAFGAAAGVELAAPSAILADIVDYDLWKSRANKSGNYTALLVITQKTSIAVGSATGYLLLDLFGFDVKQGNNSSAATFGFLVTFVYLPALLYLIASVSLWNFPINARRHAAIRRRIDSRGFDSQ